MLANCFCSDDLENAPKTKKGTTRKHSYYNHPCSKWVRESLGNYMWLVGYALELENERLARGFNPHFSFSFIKWCQDNTDLAILESEDTFVDNFALAIADDKECRKVVNDFNSLDRVTQYRLYYRYDKPFATWKRNRPYWMDYTVEQILNGE